MLAGRQEVGACFLWETLVAAAQSAAHESLSQTGTACECQYNIYNIL